MVGEQPARIEDYALIGDCETAALVSRTGSIDWLCLPHFDSPSVFAALLDDRKGGRYRIAPAGDHFRRKQFYWPDTAILVTRFLHEEGVGEVEDYMPVGRAGTGWGSRSSTGWCATWTATSHTNATIAQG